MSTYVDVTRSRTSNPISHGYTLRGASGEVHELMASMPIRTTADGTWEVVQGVPVNAFSQGKIDLTINELKEERDAVRNLIPA